MNAADLLAITATVAGGKHGGDGFAVARLACDHGLPTLDTPAGAILVLPDVVGQPDTLNGTAKLFEMSSPSVLTPDAVLNSNYDDTLVTMAWQSAVWSRLTTGAAQ